LISLFYLFQNEHFYQFFLKPVWQNWSCLRFCWCVFSNEIFIVFLFYFYSEIFNGSWIQVVGVVVVVDVAVVVVWANSRDFVKMGIRFLERRRFRETIQTDVDDYVSVVKRRLRQYWRLTSGSRYIEKLLHYFL